MDALPPIARLSLVALGRAVGDRGGAALDPVAAWVLDQAPEVAPEGVASAALATILARTRLVDGMLLEEIERARAAGARLCLWSVGGGLDARWQRLGSGFGGVVAEVREVDTPEVLSRKDHWLARSPFAATWSRVGRRPHPLSGWTVRPRSGTRPLVVAEGLAGRGSPSSLERLLQRIRYETPEAVILLGLPGQPPEAPPDPWTARRFARLGWAIREDVRRAPRGPLVGPEGEEVCPGLYPLRVLSLVGRPRP